MQSIVVLFNKLILKVSKEKIASIVHGMSNINFITQIWIYLRCYSKQHQQNVVPKIPLHLVAFDVPSNVITGETIAVDDYSKRYELLM